MPFKFMLSVAFLGAMLYALSLMGGKRDENSLAICAYRACPVNNIVNYCLESREEYIGNRPEYLKNLKQCVLEHRRDCYEICKGSRLISRDAQERREASDDLLRFELINLDELFSQAVDVIDQ